MILGFVGRVSMGRLHFLPFRRHSILVILTVSTIVVLNSLTSNVIIDLGALSIQSISALCPQSISALVCDTPAYTTASGPVHFPIVLRLRQRSADGRSIVDACGRYSLHDLLMWVVWGAKSSVGGHWDGV